MRFRRADVLRLVRAGTIVAALAAMGVHGCAPKTQPGDPLPRLTRAERDRFERGKQVFEREFAPETGLGPLFNSTSCHECHEDPATGGSGDEVEVHATAFRPAGATSRGDVCDQLAGEGGPVVQQHVTPALHDALGVWVDETPITPEKVLRALEAKQKGETPRWGPKAFPSVDYGEPIRVEPPDPHDLRVGAELEQALAGADA